MAEHARAKKNVSPAPGPEAVLRARGYRMTAIRKRMLRRFVSGHGPFSAADVAKRLLKDGFSADKTTVYRELSALAKAGIIKEIVFGDRTRRYERADGGHHHHLVCIRCKNVDEVALGKDLHKEERRIARVKKFKVERHALEFFGVCAKCK